MKQISKFKAVYCSGIAIPNQASVAALSLLFEQVHLPNNLELVVDFAKRYRFLDVPEDLEFDVDATSEGLPACLLYTSPSPRD